MKYIYDIVLNFNKEYYEFYEWNKSDQIYNIKKIPLYRVSKGDYNSIKYNKVIISNKLPKIFLITNTLEVMGVENIAGKITRKSSLLIDEEDEILDSIESVDITKIHFKKNSYIKRKIVSRHEREKEKTINSFLKNVNKKKDEYLLRYIYYNLYNKVDNIDKIYYTLLHECDINKLYRCLKEMNK